jgi:NTP pyrophosphatase (non-canonical NTP hydrolase)
MEFKELQEFIEQQHQLFRSLKGGTLTTEREDILGRAVKLSEEFGELSDEVLASMGLQRKGKLENRDPEGLSAEFADVIIVTFLLARSMNVDIPSALARKIEKIRTKHNQELKTQHEKGNDIL